MLIENKLQEFSLDALFELMLFKIEQIKLLRNQDADNPTLLAVVDDIILIQKVIDKKKSENPRRPVKSPSL